MNKQLKHYLHEQNKLPVVFDYDGVLFEARWYEDHINMYNETEEKLIAAFMKGENLYTEPIMSMYPILEKIRAPLYVLSHMHHQIEYDFKCKQLKKYFPIVKVENVVYAHSITFSNASQGKSKVEYLEMLYGEYGGFIYIDDSHQSLILLENHFFARIDKCHFYHVSSIYV